MPASTPSYELWDRPPIQLADAIAELRTDDFLGGNVTIPHKERVVPHGRPADRGGARDRRGQHADQGGPQARRPQHRRGRVQGRARQARRTPEDAAPRGGAGRRRRRARRRLRADPRGLPAGHRVQPPPPSGRGAGQALRAQRVAHGAAGDALARVDHRVRAGEDEGPGQRDVDRARRPATRPSRRDPDRRPARARPHLRPDEAAPRRGGRRRDHARTAS